MPHCQLRLISSCQVRRSYARAKRIAWKPTGSASTVAPSLPLGDPCQPVVVQPALNKVSATDRYRLRAIRSRFLPAIIAPCQVGPRPKVAGLDQPPLRKHGTEFLLAGQQNEKTRCGCTAVAGIRPGIILLAHFLPSIDSTTSGSVMV